MKDEEKASLKGVIAEVDNPFHVVDNNHIKVVNRLTRLFSHERSVQGGRGKAISY